MKKLSLYIALMWFGLASLSAQGAVPDSLGNDNGNDTLSIDSIDIPVVVKSPVQFDNGTIYERSWDEEDFKRYRGKTFDYTPREYRRSGFWRWLANLFPEPEPGANRTQSEIIRFLVIALLAAFAIFSIMRALGINRASIFRRAEKSIIDYEIEDADIREMNFEELIAKAMKAGNYRSAIRFHYLQVLDTLTKAGLIDWQVHKTNRDYIRELSTSRHNPKFRELTMLFEYYWYGDSRIDKNRFDEVSKRFSSFKSSIR